MSALVMNTAGNGNRKSFDLIHTQIDSLSGKMDKLIHIQEAVLSRLDDMPHDSEKDMEKWKVAKEEIHLPPGVMKHTQVTGQEMRNICQQMSSILSVVNQRSEQQAQKLEGIEKLVLGMQQVISFIGETMKSSNVMELMFKGPAAQKGPKPKDNKEKQAIKRKSSTEIINKKLDKLKDHKGKEETEKPCLKKQSLIPEQVQKRNMENAEKSGHQHIPGYLNREAKVFPKGQQADGPACNLVDMHEDFQVAEAEKLKAVKEVSKEKPEEKVPEGEAAIAKRKPKLNAKYVLKKKDDEELEVPEEKKEEETKVPDFPAAHDDEKEPGPTSTDEHKEIKHEHTAEVSSTNTKSFVTEKHFVVEEHRSSRVVKEEEEGEKKEDEGCALFLADDIEIQINLKQTVERENNAENDDDDDNPERYFIDTTCPPTAPFNHRIVSAKPNHIRNFYTINWQEILGGGRFGQVHKCVENSSGLTLAAKVIKARNQKEKDVVKNEIQVMNNLDHANLIQLYAAYESRNDIILVLEYMDGGELFDRIIDENYTLMELDAVVFIRQICEGVQHMHRMNILHLDLKPENILCVSRVTNKVKIIDFGLARMYKQREKLRVNFGTPEFLAPEIVNCDFVSFNTDMWSLGIITYMLLSGLCPFLGDDDSETLNNILGCQWNFEEQEFVDTSEEAKDFISRLLVVNKSWRMGASEALRHPWLSDSALHHQLYTKKTMCRSRRSSCASTSNS
uniref:myosin light chain kinase 2, skeletal/cardiac muscle n=1 Tax=Monopterus albus TaxID=43700 RepID=UPI0009B3C11A|nr:myosin light chain kinase 2, skeletal/cardiac muscle-like [Monopterus albus]